MIEWLAVLVGAVIAGLTGFGFNLVAVPLLTLVESPHDAVVVGLVLGVVVSAATSAVSGIRREVDYRTLRLLLAGGVPGLAAGTALFATVGEGVLAIVIGAATGASALAFLAQRRMGTPAAHPATTLAVGALAGAAAAATGIAGPPVIVFLIQHLRDAVRVRGTFVWHSAIISASALAAHAAAGDLSRGHLRLSAELLPSTVVGLTVGMLLFARLPKPVFARLMAPLAVLLLGLGIALAVR